LSNTAEDSSGRVGAAEALSITATGFAQAFQDQRGDADDDDDDNVAGDDDRDELGSENPRMSGALNGFSPNRVHSVLRSLDFHQCCILYASVARYLRFW
jgi:hypothetical protein